MSGAKIKMNLAWRNRMTASPWEFMLARIFGKKWVGCDQGMQVIVKQWRGKSYVTNVRKIR